MEKLLKGLHQFQSNTFSTQRGLFERLAHGQRPEALFITCSDSRINPNLLTQTEPGDLFILRNAGNIVPPHGAANGGEGATIEYAVVALGIRHIIVCGHSKCGAMHGLLHPETVESLPTVAAWLKHAQATRRIVETKYPDADEENKLDAAVKENVLVQLEHLRTLPEVAVRLARNELQLHAWVYKFETGEVLAYDPESKRFLDLSAGSRATMAV